jgi:hypothetical protein
MKNFLLYLFLLVIPTSLFAQYSGGFGRGDISFIYTPPCNNPTFGGTISADQTICSGSTPVSLTSTSDASGNLGVLDYKWQKSTTSSTSGYSDILGATSANYSPNSITQTTWYKRIARVTCMSNWIGAAESNVIMIAVGQASVGGAVGSAQSICTGTIPTNLLLTGYVGAVVKWQKSANSSFSPATDITETSSTLLGTTIGNLSANTYFRAVVQNGTCSVAYSASALISIASPTVGGTISSAQMICSGTSPANLTLTGNIGNVVKWQKSTDLAFTNPIDIASTSTTLLGSTIGNLSTNTYFRAEVQSGTCSVVNTNPILITVTPATVGGTVSSAQTICSGTSPANLTLTGNIGNVIKWQKSTDLAFTNPIDIAGTSTTLLGTTIGTLTANTYFRAVVQSGTCSIVNTSPVLITIASSTIGGTVSSAQTICSGTSPANLTLTGNVGNVIKWQKSIDLAFTTPVDIAETTTTLQGSTIGNLAANTYFRAVVQSGTCSIVYTTPVLVTITPSTVGGTVSSAQTICSGTLPANLTLTGNIGSVIKWQKSTDLAFTTPVDITETSTTLLSSTIGNLTSNTYFRAVVQNGICSVVNSTPILITVNAISVGGTVLSAQTICSGSTPISLTLSSNVGSVIKWQKSSNISFSTPTDISVTTNTLTSATIGNLTSSTYFRSVVQSGVCTIANSTPVLITVLPVTVGGSVSSAQTICSGTSPANLTLTGNVGNVLKWQKSSNIAFTSPIDISGNTTTLLGSTIGNLTANTYLRAVVQSDSCSILNSAPVLITVAPISVGGTVSSAQTICSGTSPANLTLTGNVGNVIKWQKSTDLAFTSQVDITETTTTLQGTTIGNLTVNTYFRAVVQSGTCSIVNTIPVLITVNPISVGGTVSSAQTICSGTSPANLTLTGNVGSVIKWQRSIDLAFTTPIDIPGTSTILTPGDIGNLTNSSYYRAVVQSGVCSITNSAPVLIIVDSLTVGGVLTGGSTICSGNTSNLLSLNGNTGSVVKWQSSIIPFNTWTDILNTSTTYTSGILNQTTQYRVVLKSGSCTSENSGTTTVIVNPPSIGGSVSVGVSQILLGQSTGNITLTGQNGSILKWQKRLGTGSWINIANTNSIYIETPNVVGFWEYRAVLQSGSCPVVYSSTVVIEVLASNAGAVTGGSSPICFGLGTNTMTLGGYTGTIIKWQKRVDAGVWIDIVNTNTIYSEIPASSGIWEYRAVINNISDLYSAPTIIEVNPVTVGGTISGGTTVCLGNISGTLTLTGYTGTILNWQSAVAPFTSWTDIPNTAFTYDAGQLLQTTKYRALIQSGSCASLTSEEAIETVNLTTIGGTVTSGSTICYGNTSGALTLNGNVGNVIKWQSSISPFTLWSDISNSGNDYTSGVLTQTTKFRAVVQNGVCSIENSLPATVSVDSLSIGGQLSTSVSQIYLGQSTSIISLNGQFGAILKWQKRLGNGSWIDISNTLSSYSETPNSVGIWEYRVVIQNGNCSQVNSMSITIEVLATNAGLVSGGLTPICIGSSTGTMTLSGFSGTIVNWQKRLNGGTWIDITNNTTVYSEVPTSFGVWEYRAVVNNVIDQYSTAMSIVVNPNSVGGTVSGGSTICTGNTSDLLTLIDYTGSIVKWQKSITPFTSWTDISNTSATYTSNVLIQPTQFRAVVKSGSCNSEFSVPANILVDQMPTAAFSYVANNLNVNFSNQSVNATSYSWLFGSGSASSIEVNPSFTYPAPSTYSVILNAFNGQCSATETKLITVTNVKVEELSNQIINVFPIPTTGLLTVSFGTEINENAQLDIFDINGKLVWSKSIKNMNIKQNLDLDLSTFVTGVYRLRVINKQQIINKVFIIER